MYCDKFSVLYAIYFGSLTNLVSNSRLATRWQLNKEKKRIVPVDELGATHRDYLFEILNSAITYGDYWVVEGINLSHVNNEPKPSKSVQMNSDGKGKRENHSKRLSCGKAVKFTWYDHLEGVLKRFNHPNISVPRIAFLFVKEIEQNFEIFNVNLEEKLNEELQTNWLSAFTWNQIGNYWSMTGNTLKAIECYRKALSIQPNNADFLVNLARLFYYLNYIDDAFYLAKKSIDNGPFASTTAWFQHFTIGEILTDHGNYKQARHYFHQCLNVNPHFQPAIDRLSNLVENRFYNVHCAMCLILTTGLAIVFIRNLLLSCVEKQRKGRHRRRVAGVSALRWFACAINMKTMRRKKYS